MTDLDLSFLSFLEERETRLLSWGYVDGGFNREEVEALADDFALEHDTTGTATGAQVVRRLRDRALLLEVDDGTTRQYRTRMAETVRLLSRLRQLFPKHKNATWSTAATLVADYRLLTRPRAYPRRDITVDEAVEDLSARGLLTGTRRNVLESLLANRAPDEFLLSRFQIDATIEITSGLDARKSGGTIVGAGTGSGKTLAFYLPALTHVVTADGKPGTRVLAIYPRIELLRDQFAEAYREARRLDGVGDLGRPIRIGALYGSTPHVANGATRIWKARGGDRICPYMLCPSCGEGQLIWTAEAIAASRHVLRCAACNVDVPDGHLTLTRKQMRDEPPDVLFTTTEMLNRVLMDDGMRHVVGAGPKGMPIDMVLLDEVHTYEGTTGAHVAGVLRRWRHARRRPVYFVGLSATLREAGSFFSTLTGLAHHQITTIEPRAEDLEYEGQEYLLAARADPHSGASVLSTTIQTTMLMQRVLDPLRESTSDGAFGQRVFVFTDDLDVTNRLYFDLLDAEGLNSWGTPEKPSLAMQRGPTAGDLTARRAGGQSWEALEQIGHPLDEHSHLSIGRTTSQDADVDRSASAIVATASLEVGFNDPKVGAVIQHKSPHDTAAFLQRKGRAGRSRAMRPWTVVVLSDYGRDRTSYDAYERLFDPELPARTLPIANPAVVRMQAVFATLDWLAARIDNRAQVWSLLQKPAKPSAAKDLDLQSRMATLLENTLADPAARQELAAHLKAALAGGETLVNEIFWEPPRPLLTTAIPTAIRRLKTGWRHLELGEGRDLVGDGPLPEFIVSRLFGDLALPEITVITPAQGRGENEHREPMRAVQALNAYAPGRVSHRLTIVHRHARHWVAPPPLTGNGPTDMDVRTFIAEAEDLGTFGRATANEATVLRPAMLRVESPPAEILSSSHGRLQWNAEVQPSAPSEQVLRPPQADALAGLVSRVAFHTHGAHAHVEVKRWASEVDVETRTQSGTTRGRVRLVDGARGGTPVAIGLAIAVDALALDVRVPDALLSEHRFAEAHLRSLRVDRFRHILASAPGAQRILGDFGAERLSRDLLLALIQAAAAGDRDLQAAYLALRDTGALNDAIVAAASGDEDSPDLQSVRGHEFAAALTEPAVLDAIETAVPALWEDPDATWDAWAADRLAATVAAAFHAALQELCPEYDADEIVIDIESAQDGQVRAWLSEQTVGGGGILQEALRRIGDRPRRFFDLVSAAVEPTIDEVVEVELARVAENAASHGSVAARLDEVRNADGQADRMIRFDDLLRTLGASGVFACHPVVSALSVRFLRPGSSAQTDAAIWNLLKAWTSLEEQLGIDIDLRTFAAHAARDNTFDNAARLVPPPGDAVAWRTGQISGLLWQRGRTVRSHTLRTPNPFSAPPAPDPLLLRERLGENADSFPLEQLNRALDSQGPLAVKGDAVLTSSPDAAADLRRALLRAAATPIEAGALLHYPRVEGIRRDLAGYRARLVVDLVGE